MVLNSFGGPYKTPLQSSALGESKRACANYAQVKYGQK